MQKENFNDKVTYYIDQYPNIYQDNKRKVLMYMYKRWKSAFSKTANILNISLTNQSLPDVGLVCDMGAIDKSDEDKFVADFRDVIRGLNSGKILNDDSEWVDTRCLIGIIEDDLCKAIFCRGDGDLVHTGENLIKNYDKENLKKLISLGDVWTLGTCVGEKHDPNEPTPGYTVFHERDRGIEDNSWLYTFNNYSDLLKRVDWSTMPIFFILKNDAWFVGAPKKNYGNIIQKGSVLRLDEVLKKIKN